MSRRFWRLACVVVAASLAASATFSQTVQLHRVMREKLWHSQKILEAVVTSDWKEMERRSLALQQLTADPAWAVLTTPEYAQFTADFTHATRDLLDAARRRDLEAAPQAYVSLTLSCVRCHRYVAGARVVRR